MWFCTDSYLNLDQYSEVYIDISCELILDDNFFYESEIEKWYNNSGKDLFCYEKLETSDKENSDNENI